MKRRLILSSILFYSILFYSCSNSSTIVPVPVPISTPEETTPTPEPTPTPTPTPEETTPTPTPDPTPAPATDETASGGVLLSTKNLALKVDQTKNNGIVTFTPTVERFDEIYGEEGDEAPYIEYTWKIDGVLAQNIAGANVNSESGVLTIDTSKFKKDSYQINCLAQILFTIKVEDEESTLKLAIFSWQDSLKVN